MNPMLGLADAMVKEGWQVHFYVPKNGQQLVEGVGAIWRSMGRDDWSTKPTARAFATETLELEVGPGIAALPFAVVPAALEALPYLLASVAELKPRFVVFDACAPWGLLVAQILKVPCVSCMSALPTSMGEREENSKKADPATLKILNVAVAQIKSTYGIDYNHNYSYQDYAPYTVICSSRCWHSGNEEFPQEQFHYWGPLISERKGFATQAGSSAVGQLLSNTNLGQAGYPLFFCSLGTVTTSATFQVFEPAVRDYYQKLCQAAALLPHVTCVFAVGEGAELTEVVDAMGMAHVVELFGEVVPSNVVVARRVDQPTVLQRANGFLTHCGQNSTTETINAGVPVIVSPFFGDQITNAMRFHELGCGLVQSFHPDLATVESFDLFAAPLDFNLVTPESLAAAMRQILEEPEFQNAMGKLKAAQDDEVGESMAEKIASLVAHVNAKAEKMKPCFSKFIRQPLRQPKLGGM